MDRHYKCEECTWTDITSERNVHGTDITSWMLDLAYTENFQLWSMTILSVLRQSNIVDYRAAYFTAKN